jgi:replicative DNA helicase
MSYPTIQKAIIKGLLTVEEFAVKVIPYIKPEYFKYALERELVTEAVKFYLQYKKLPTEAALIITISKNLPSQENIDELNEYVQSLNELELDIDWLVAQTEEFCRKSDFELSISKALDVLEGDSKTSIYDIPRLLQDSLAISFDPSTSHDFFRDSNKQFSWYKEKVDKIPFDLEMFNKITSGGVERKTLNVMLAGTGIGKSLFMCHFAAKYLEQGYNVLYITLELSEHKIRQRIDANLLDIPIQNFVNIEEGMYFAKMKWLKDRVKGILKIHEFPPASVSVNHFRKVIEDLNLKDNFRPDIICIDYLNLMNSSRIKQGKSYEVVKSVAEECRGLAVEYNACVWTGTQVNREGYRGDDINLENTSESMGLPFTADIFLGLSADENLQKAQHVKVKQLKSRYGDINFYNKFIVGIDKPKMRLYDVVQSNANDTTGEQIDSTENSTSFDRSKFGKRMRGESQPKTFDDFDF